MNDASISRGLSGLRVATEKSFTSHDGEKIFYRHWSAAGPAKGAIVLLHRGHEHSGRVAHLAEELDLPDFEFYAWDARGHGLTAGPRGFSPSFAHTVKDLQCFIDHIGKQSRLADEDIAVIAQSVGAVIAATWAHDYAPRIRALVLASPAFDIKLYVPFAREGIALWQKIKGRFYVNSYVRPGLLTHDVERAKSYAADPLIARPIASHILLQVYRTSKRIIEDARAITLPVLMLVSGRDFVVRAEPQHRFFENLGSTIRERHVLPGFFHDTLGERDRATAMGLIRTFIQKRFAEPVGRVDLTKADISGYSRDEFERLSSPLPSFSLRNMFWTAYRGSTWLGSLLSEGLKRARKTGFDSGTTLDYVYENEPRGKGSIGRMIDKTFLDAIGWKGIRQRKINLQAAIHKALLKLDEAGKTRNIVDIAAGHGRYVLDAISRSPVLPTSVTLRDYSDLNVEKGSDLIGERGLANLARFVKADAFDEQSLAVLSPSPDLAIVSGLYELFSDNRQISASLRGLARSMKPGALLIYTNQPWHPQLEMIARALTSHRNGQPWVMRRRTQGEMDQLVEAQGFRKIDQSIDKWGIFTVSIAERI